MITSFGVCAGFFVHACCPPSARGAPQQPPESQGGIFYLAFLPQFISPTDPVLQRSLVLAAIHYVEGIAWLLAWTFLIDRTRRVFLSAAVRRWLDGLCGLVLVGLEVRLAFERR